MLKLKNKPTEKESKCLGLVNINNQKTCPTIQPEELLTPQLEASQLLHLNFKSKIMLSTLKINKKYHFLFERAILSLKKRKDSPHPNRKNEAKKMGQNIQQKIINKLKPTTTNRNTLSNFTSFKNQYNREKRNPSLQEFINLGRERAMGLKNTSMRNSLARRRNRSVQKPQKIS